MSRCRACEPLPEEIRRAAELLERRWLLSILYAAHAGAVRFNEFRQALGNVPPRTLATRLSELEAAGVFDRVVIASKPPRVEYVLTDDGRRLGAVVRAMSTWACEREPGSGARTDQAGAATAGG